MSSDSTAPTTDAPADLPLDETQQALYDVLADAHGPDQAITSSELAAELGLDESNGNPTIRFEIRALIDRTGLPIGAGPQGYYRIETREQLHDYVDRLQARKAGINDRIVLVTTAFDGPPRQHALGKYVTDGGDADVR